MRRVPHENIVELCAWAHSRIEECRRQETKFGSYEGKHPPQALIEAWTERRALQAVLNILDRAAREGEG